MTNAAGGKAPPLTIFKGQFMWDQWCAPKGTGYLSTEFAASKNGWMESEIFSIRWNNSYQGLFKKIM
jgi:hypothetical protein